jgi:hypothetical protein
MSRNAIQTIQLHSTSFRCSYRTSDCVREIYQKINLKQYLGIPYLFHFTINIR